MYRDFHEHLSSYIKEKPGNVDKHAHCRPQRLRSYLVKEGGGGRDRSSLGNGSSRTLQTFILCVCATSLQSSPTLLHPCGLQATRLLCPWDSPGNTGVGCHALLQGIFPTQGSNLRLLPWQVDLLHWNHPVMRTQSFLEVYYMERGFRGYAGNGQDKPRR